MFPKSKEKFKEIAQEANLVPVYEEYPAFLETPLSVFLKLKTGAYAFLLESVEKGVQVGRYSFIGVEPSLIFSSKDGTVSLREKGELNEYQSPDPLKELEKIFQRYTSYDVPDLPLFNGGAVGFFGYNMIRYWEELPPDEDKETEYPDCLMMFGEKLVIFDHVKQTIKLVVNVSVTGNPENDYETALVKIREMQNCLDDKRPVFPRVKKLREIKGEKYLESCSKELFKKMVEKAKDYIQGGDIFQVVLSRQVSFDMAADPLAVYCELRRTNPSPYMYYLSFDEIEIVGSSPEVLVKVEKGRAELRPIAGTRPRGRDCEEDEELAGELLADEKERAEHLMLVDLGRNDLGRVCEYGSVEVEDFMTVENYSHVMHIVSKVVGRLQRNINCFDVLRSSFPAGTVSGAPKIRAMEIIDELEPVGRGPYAGAVGYISYSGNMDMCIAIRTLFTCRGRGFIQAGAGIVADSDPLKEYQETNIKAQALINAFEAAERGDIYAAGDR